MNIIEIAKVAGILWKASKPLAERILRDAEYRKICSELDTVAELDRVRMRTLGGVEAGKGRSGQDKKGDAGKI